MNSAYSALAPFYEALLDGVDYAAWADYIEKCFALYGNDIKSVVDIGCGTGVMTTILAKRGYDMTGVDLCPDMLSVAASRNDCGILYLMQDMTSLDLYGTADAFICCLDGINHLTNETALSGCFDSVSLFLNPGGLFLFDVNTPYKFENLYGLNDYILECDDAVCCWRNNYNKKSRVCDFDLTVFSRRSNGSYDRQDALQREKCYDRQTLEALLNRSGFKIVSFSGSFDNTAPSPTCERWYICAQAAGEPPEANIAYSLT